MIRTVVIEDEEHSRKMLMGMLREQCPAINVVGSADSVTTGLTAIAERRPELVFLDIELQSETSFEILEKLPEINFVDDKEGKPVGIHQYIGKRPVFVAGNSDGDYAMLQYTCTSTAPHFGMIVHHTDSIREYAYDRQSSVGHLEKGLDDAAKYDWLIVDMKNDWKVVFPFDQ